MAAFFADPPRGCRTAVRTHRQAMPASRHDAISSATRSIGLFSGRRYFGDPRFPHLSLIGR